MSPLAFSLALFFSAVPFASAGPREGEPSYDRAK